MRVKVSWEEIYTVTVRHTTTVEVDEEELAAEVA